MKINQLDTYKTMQVLSLAFIVAYLIFKINYLLFGAAILLLLPLLLYKMAYYITYGWLKFSHILGAVNSKIILSVVFFIFLTPLALIYQITGRKIQLLDKEQNSAFTERNHEYTAKDLEKPW